MFSLYHPIGAEHAASVADSETGDGRWANAANKAYPPARWSRTMTAFR
jgi:hypothetical protein